MSRREEPEFDKIQILLVDDMAEGLTRPTARGAPDVPAMGRDYADWFDFKWLATPEECCEFRDLSWLIGQNNPRVLAESGWVPEILVIDYSLTPDHRTVSSRVHGFDGWEDRLSPLPGLRKCARETIENPPTDRRAFHLQPTAGSEYWGCLVGGLLINTFGDAPCAPVTITRYSQQQIENLSVDTVFFEWLMDVQSSGLLRAAGQAYSPPWQEIIPTGVANLRHRLVDLARASIVFLSLEDLLAMADDVEHPALSVTSRYGRRRYPVAGLFVDVDADERSGAAAAWARGLLVDTWDQTSSDRLRPDFEQTVKELRQGRVLAESLWDAYCDDELVGKRLRLSELLARERGQSTDPTPLESEEISELAALKGHFAIRNPEKANPSCERGCVELRQPECGTTARRWATLMIVVRLLHDRYRAVLRAREYLGRGRHEQRIDPALEAPIAPADVYLALFPVPQTPAILPWHAKKSDPASSWGRYVKELDLDLKEVLSQDGSWDASRAERWLLRMYAASVGARNEDWGLAEWRRDPTAEALLFGVTQGRGS